MKSSSANQLRPLIIYEDAYLIILNKPAGMLSIPDRYNPSKPNVSDWLNSGEQKFYTVHRLDKETSGIICFAKNPTTHAALNESFRTHQVSKKYLAFITGNHLPEEGEIIGDLSPDPHHPGRMLVSKKGKKSITHYHVVERFREASLVAVEILTGRQHQIRAHFKSIDFPLLVDRIYGSRDQITIQDIKHKKFVQAGDSENNPSLMHRTSLHAWKLAFKHPDTAENLAFEAETPKDFKALLNQLRKWSK